MIEHTIIQGSDEWLSLRDEYFTASEASAMLGLSKQMKRNELLAMKATGNKREFSDFVQKHVLDKGHEAEEKARPIVESLILEDLAPITGSIEIDGLKLLASFDGITLDDNTCWENKLWNADLASDIEAGIVEDNYWPQLEQQLLVSGASKVYFTASDGTVEKTVGMYYESVPKRRKQLISGWKQFAEDLANYQHIETIPESVATPVKDLPAVIYKIDGLALTSNLPAFKSAALALVEDSKKPMETDQDFADRIELCKKFGEAEKKIELLQSQVVGEIHDVNSFCVELGEISKMFRQARLSGEKLVEAEKTNRKNVILSSAKTKLAEHIAALNARLGKPYMPEISADFVASIKGMKSMASMQNAVDSLLATSKIKANEIADKIDANLKTLRELGSAHAFLFADTAQIVLKDNDDLTALVKARIADHNAETERKEEETRARIRKEEQERADREAMAKVAAAPNVSETVAPVIPAPTLSTVLHAVAPPVIAQIISPKPEQETAWKIASLVSDMEEIERVRVLQFCERVMEERDNTKS